MAKSSSVPEQIVADWLTEHDILFATEIPFFGGTAVTGGARVDFLLPLHRVILRIQSYWHEGVEARDEIQKIHLAAEGYQVVDIWEEKLLENVDRVMEEAVEGREV